MFFCLDADAAWELSRAWSSDLSTFQGAVRCYSTKFDCSDDKFRHRLWLADTILRLDAQRKNGFLDACVSHVFTQVTAKFESWPLLTPLIVRRQLELESVQQDKLQLSVHKKAASSQLLESAITAELRPTEHLYVPEVLPDYAQYRTEIEELQKKLARTEEQARDLESNLQQERASRAESERQRDESEEFRRLWEEDNQRLQDQLNALVGLGGEIASEALRPLWGSFGSFVSSLQNVTTQFRRMEAEANKAEQVCLQLESAQQANATLSARAEFLETRKYNEHSPSSQNFDLLIKTLPQLKLNPSLNSSLKLIAACFPSRLTILDSAYNSASSASTFKYGNQALELLWLLATDYWEKVQSQGDIEARKVFGKAFASNEGSVLSKIGQASRSFKYGDQEVLMNKHLKIGVAWNDAETLRIHFEWFPESTQIVIGHCGGHLSR